jgi:PTH1 family peptidyl-tRNA hydrolase
MKLLVGLGNPGQKYADNRHNIGFVVVDEIVRRHGLAGPRMRFQAETFDGTVGRERVLALKPTTYMNESGRAVSEAMRFFKLEPGDVTVIHDEIDLAAGKLKIRIGGGTAGHNGLRSIDRHIGPEFTRVRIGVGHPGRKDLVASYVLKDFAKAEREWIEPMVDALAAHAEDLVRGDIAAYSNKVHLALNPRDGGKDGKPGQKDRQDDA